MFSTCHLSQSIPHKTTHISALIFAGEQVHRTPQCTASLGDLGDLGKCSRHKSGASFCKFTNLQGPCKEPSTVNANRHKTTSSFFFSVLFLHSPPRSSSDALHLYFYLRYIVAGWTACLTTLCYMASSDIWKEFLEARLPMGDLGYNIVLQPPVCFLVHRDLHAVHISHNGEQDRKLYCLTSSMMIAEYHTQEVIRTPIFLTCRYRPGTAYVEAAPGPTYLVSRTPIKSRFFVAQPPAIWLSSLSTQVHAE
ncbi:hypothetical protein F5Y17DRAFT_315394 [Xylariaceae sp. FL0594]|nr:hypothetical protein F5Y17DRAFT_315394 [Xylariaceae sp. FL0594]